MQSGRFRYLDFGAGIMILYMMIGHALQSQFSMELYGLEHGIIWSGLNVNHIQMVNGVPREAYHDALYPYLHFFMAWFFYKSGQFFSKRTSMELLHKDANKLLRMFLIWSAIGYVFHVCILGMRGVLTLRAATLGVIKCFVLYGNIPLNTPLWFLFTLFIVRQIANVVLPDRGSKYFSYVCASIICSTYILSYILWRYHSEYMPYYVANSIMGLMFFTLGYCIANYETKWWIYVPCFLGYVACCIWGFSVVQFLPNTLHSGYYLLNMPSALAGIVTFNVLCRLVAKYVPKITVPFEVIGKNALILYVAHGILYTSLASIILNFQLTSIMPYAIWLIIAAYILVLPCVSVLSRNIRLVRQKQC